MDYYDEEFYNEPSEFEMQIDEFKQALIESVKKEYVDEMDRLRKENAELQDFKENKKAIENEHRQALHKMETEKAQFEKSLKNKRLTDLFGENMFTAWYPNSKSIKPPKCDQCDDNREIHFTSPSGKKLTEPCPTCGNSKSVYEPEELECYKFTQGKPDRWTDECRIYLYFRRVSSDKDDYFESNRKAYDGGKYEEVRSYDTAFFDLEECQKYCDWKNKPKESDK